MAATVHPVDEVLPAPKLITLGLQHVLVMYAGAVAVPLIVGVRYLGNLLLMVAFLGPTHGRQMVRTQRTGLVWVRGLCLALASLLIAFALQRMPVAEMTAITFLSPILLVAVAGRLLGERVGWVGWAATVAGFAGVMLIVRPGSDIVARPSPKNSTNLPTTPCRRSICVTVSTRSVAVAPSGSCPLSWKPTTSGISM